LLHFPFTIIKPETFPRNLCLNLHTAIPPGNLPRLPQSFRWMNEEELQMTKKMRTTQIALVAAIFAGALWCLPPASFAAAQSAGATAAAQADNSAPTDAAARLNKKQYRDVKVTVDNGIATLTGAVDLYEYKADAEKRVRKAKSVTAVRNLIEVAGPNISDQELQAKLAEKLAYDRVGYSNAFNAISVRAENGVVTLAGHARTDVDKDSALALVATHPGVKDVIEEIEVDPVSIMDDQTRMAVARAVYGYPSLSRYSIDPANPIRISVQNGHVELYGTVDSQGDKDTAFIRANGVAGVFSVKNYLQVANQPSERQK
jgi:osmotically-inducible protein OsmY